MEQGVGAHRQEGPEDGSLPPASSRTAHTAQRTVRRPEWWCSPIVACRHGFFRAHPRHQPL